MCSFVLYKHYKKPLVIMHLKKSVRKVIKKIQLKFFQVST